MFDDQTALKRSPYCADRPYGELLCCSFMDGHGGFCSLPERQGKPSSSPCRVMREDSAERGQELLAMVPIEALLKERKGKNDPFRRVPPSWGSFRLSMEDVLKTTETHKTPFVPMTNSAEFGRQGSAPWTQERHLQRIRYLYEFVSSDPVEIEVTREGDLNLIDGYHRLVADIVRGEKEIFATFEWSYVLRKKDVLVQLERVGARIVP